MAKTEKPLWWSQGEDILSEMLAYECDHMSAFETADHIGNYNLKHDETESAACTASFLYGGLCVHMVEAKREHDSKKWWKFWDTN
jgi:hypothetical protein